MEDDEILLVLHEIFVKKSALATHPFSCSNGKVALDHLLNNHQEGQHHLVLLDLNMPVMDGWEFLEKISGVQFTKDIYVIVVTSSTSNLDKEKAGMYKNVIDFIEKPIGVEGCVRIKSLPAVIRYFK